MPHQARLAFWSGDLPTMRQWLDQLPARARAEERAVISYVIWSLSSGSWEFGLSTLSTYTETWLFDANTYTGPTALLQAMLLAQQGKAGLARVQYEAALVELSHRRKENPSDQTTRNSEVWIMLGLGRTEEARALHHTDVESLRRPFRVLMTSVWWYGPIPRSLLVGDRETALQLIREGASEAEGRKWIRRQLQTDVRMAPFRDDPQITALLADPK